MNYWKKQAPNLTVLFIPHYADDVVFYSYCGCSYCKCMTGNIFDLDSGLNIWNCLKKIYWNKRLQKLNYIKFVYDN